MTIRVAYAEDDPAAAQRLEKALRFDNGLRLVGKASNGRDIITIAEKTKPDIILMDINMPHLNGLQSTEQIKALLPATKTIMLTIEDNQNTIFDALKVGASGYMLKDTDIEVLLRNIKYVYQGGTILPPKVAQPVLQEFSRVLKWMSRSIDADKVEELSEREIEILRLVTAGLDNKEISESLYISEGTVKNYVSKLLKKLKVKDRVQLVLYGIRAGLKI